MELVKIQASPALTLKTRFLVLTAVLFCASVLFGYLYMCMPPHARHGRARKVTPRFLQSKGGRQSLLEQRLALSSTQHDVTIVTAYINLGSFQKGEGGTVFTPELYREWIKVFHLITNPVVAYFDSDRDIEMFKVLRNMMPKNMTKIVKITRNTTWAFSLRPAIEEIFSQPFYPAHHPNTVIPDYSCAMHAKYEFMASAVKNNPFNTRYFAWLDIGLFRDLVKKSEQPFGIYLPPKFDPGKVAYGQVERLPRVPKTAQQIVQGNLVWVCGCFFIAKYDIMERWTTQYRAFTERMLKTKWISTDQQVLFYMFQPQHKQSVLMDVQIQPYDSNGQFNEWFHLGYLSARSWKKENNETKMVQITLK